MRAHHRVVILAGVGGAAQHAFAPGTVVVAVWALTATQRDPAQQSSELHTSMSARPARYGTIVSAAPTYKRG